MARSLETVGSSGPTSESSYCACAQGGAASRFRSSRPQRCRGIACSTEPGPAGSWETGHDSDNYLRCDRLACPMGPGRSPCVGTSQLWLGTGADSDVALGSGTWASAVVLCGHATALRGPVQRLEVMVLGASAVVLCGRATWFFPAAGSDSAGASAVVPYGHVAGWARGVGLRRSSCVGTFAWHGPSWMRRGLGGRPVWARQGTGRD
jgi:hypothetical protein